MPSPEVPRGEPPREPALPSYVAIARFRTAATAGTAYTAAQNALYRTPDANVSVFRLQFQQDWHVVALGEPPPPDLAEALAGILASGEPSGLPDGVVRALQERRIQASRQAPWVERHQILPPNAEH